MIIFKVLIGFCAAEEVVEARPQKVPEWSRTAQSAGHVGMSFFGSPVGSDRKQLHCCKLDLVLQCSERHILKIGAKMCKANFCKREKNVRIVRNSRHWTFVQEFPLFFAQSPTSRPASTSSREIVSKKGEFLIESFEVIRVANNCQGFKKFIGLANQQLPRFGGQRGRLVGKCWQWLATSD